MDTLGPSSRPLAIASLFIGRVGPTAVGFRLDEVSQQHPPETLLFGKQLLSAIDTNLSSCASPVNCCGSTPATGGHAYSSCATTNRFVRATCDHRFKDRMLNETHASDRQRETPLRVLLSRMRHDGCGGRTGRVELMTGVDGVSSRPVRRIVPRG